MSLMGDCPNPRFRPDQNALVRGFHAQYHSHWRAARGRCRGLACHHRARDGGAGTVGCWHLERLVGSFRPARQSGKREPPVTGITHEYGYLLTTGTGVSEITAINDHEFLVDERDGLPTTMISCRVWPGRTFSMSLVSQMLISPAPSLYRSRCRSPRPWQSSGSALPALVLRAAAGGDCNRCRHLPILCSSKG